MQIGFTTLSKIRILIHNVQAKEVYAAAYTALSGTIGINTTEFAKGTYILSVQDEAGALLATYKIIKQ